MFFKRFRWFLVIGCMFVIFMMSHLNGVKSWYLTGELLTVAKTGSVDSESGFDEKMASYDAEDTWSQMVFLRKFAHFAEYFVLAVLLMNALLFKFSVKRSATISFIWGALYGVLDELHQLFVPGRTCSVTDMLLDGMGVLAGCLFVVFIVSFRKANVYGG